jgi:anaerobic ribonucleoside-triphosphate reductase activating protein
VVTAEEDRAVVWFQGPTLGCPGCFNPATHDPLGGYETDTRASAAQILTLYLYDKIEVISISGGEPLQQPEALLDLLERLGSSALSRLLFTGYTLPEVQDLAAGPAILKRVDVLIAGRYLAAKHVGRGGSGSANQHIHLLTSRYTFIDIARIPSREVILHTDGTRTRSGIVAVDFGN